jgi:hypothetical protein
MFGWVLFGDSEALAGDIGFATLCVTVAAYYISVDWRKARQAQIEADLRREMIQ